MRWRWTWTQKPSAAFRTFTARTVPPRTNSSYPGAPMLPGSIHVFRHVLVYLKRYLCYLVVWLWLFTVKLTYAPLALSLWPKKLFIFLLHDSAPFLLISYFLTDLIGSPNFSHLFQDQVVPHASVIHEGTIWLHHEDFWILVLKDEAQLFFPPLGFHVLLHPLGLSTFRSFFFCSPHSSYQ